MTGALAMRSPVGRGRGFRVGVLAGLSLPLVLLAFSLLGGSGPSSTGPATKALSPEGRALVVFEEALEPIVDAGATTVVYGMRPGIADIAEGRFADDTLVTMAEGWLRSMEEVQAQFGALAVPAGLGEVGDLYRASFAAYVDTARSLLAAARTSGEERSALITEAASLGTRADDLFDAAEREVERRRADLGLDDAG